MASNGVELTRTSESKWVRRAGIALALLVTVQLGACTTPDNSSDTAPPSSTLTDETPQPGRFLPKQETTWEARQLGKADTPEDQRLNLIDSYRITRGPSTAVRFPGEFEPQSQLLVGWVYGQSMGGASLDTFFLDIIRGAWGVATIVIPSSSSSVRSAMRSAIKQMLSAAGRNPAEADDSRYLSFVSIALDSVWARDFGPQFVEHTNGRLSIVDTRYYRYRVQDDRVPSLLAKQYGINVFRPSISQEGGNFQANGAGECFTSRGSIYFNAPDPSESAHLELYKKYFGCKRLHFLYPLEGEGTTHIDMFMMVIGERDIVVGQYRASDDCTNRDLLEKNVQILASIKDGNGQPYFRIHRIPMPPNKDGVWRTYTNFQMVRSAVDPGRGVVLLPVYSGLSSYQNEMLATLESAFKSAHPSVSWTILPINADRIIRGNGAIHCVVHEIPAGTFSKAETDPSDLCGNAISCQSNGCGSISTAGLCDGNNLVYCSTDQFGNKLGVTWLPCATPCQMADSGQPCAKSCGWNASQGYYDCVAKYVCGSTSSTTTTPTTSTTPTTPTTPSTPTSPTTSTTPSTPTSSCTDSCTLGTRGCDGDTAWRCVEGASGCAVKASTACPSGTCLTGTCLDSSTSCYGIDDVGVCYNDAVYYCSEQQLYRLDCPQSGRHCGFSTSHSYYDCL